MYFYRWYLLSEKLTGSMVKFARNGKRINRNQRLRFDLFLDIQTNFILEPVNFSENKYHHRNFIK